MRKFRKLTSLLIILISAMVMYGWMGQSQIMSPAVAPMSLVNISVPTISPHLQRTLDQYTENLQRSHRLSKLPGLAVAVVKDGQLVLAEGYGESDMRSRAPIDTTSVFRIASLSKSFAAALAGTLVDEGLLQWDDPVIMYLPDFRLSSAEATQQVTIRHLLSHASGLPRHSYSNLLNAEVPYRDIVPRLSKVRLAAKPGERYDYQNVAFNLIADIVEKITGKNYDTLLEERIFQPLGMRYASAGYSGILNSEKIAMPHEPLASGGHHRIDLSNRWYDVMPAAGVNASVVDMAKYLELMMGYHPEVLSDSTLQELTRKQIEVSPKEGVMRAWGSQQESGYGLGWRMLEKYGRRIIFHGGFVNGYRAEIGFCPEENIGIVLLSNSLNNVVGPALRSFFDQYFTSQPQI